MALSLHILGVIAMLLHIIGVVEEKAFFAVMGSKCPCTVLDLERWRYYADSDDSGSDDDGKMMWYGQADEHVIQPKRKRGSY